ncbi:MAG: hypothetical protein DSY80_04835 [Desulfocapsa sp.]|nr:MAG: hypothetical protein DSY80_04835 [Desulfocapsa sp.]
MPIKQEYTKQTTEDVALFVESLQNHVAVDERDGVTLDSASATDFASTIINQSSSATGVVVPDQIKHILEDAKNSVKSENKKQQELAQATVLDSITQGINLYERLHGEQPSADLIESAIHQGYGRTSHASETFKATLDSADSTHHDQMSLQPNRAIVAITAAISEGIPIAHYLPADIKSNEARLLIATHHAGSTFGEYSKNDLMDGTSSGKAFTSSSRVIKLALDAGKYGGKFTVKMTDAETCDPNAESMPLMRGRTIIYVNGFKAAMETSATGTATESNISGEVKLNVSGTQTTFVVTGWIKPKTGEIEISPNNAFPANTTVHAEAFIDFEEKPSLVPLINTSAESFSMFASPWKVRTEQTVDTFTQMSNEMGINPAQESMLAVRQQQANERHYKVIQMALRLGANNSETFDMKWGEQGLAKSRADIWGEFGSVLGVVGQTMAERNMEYGPTHLYVTKNIKAQLEGLPRSLFTPSGVSERPGIYRVGKFMGKQVYYAPRFLKDINATSSQILVVGRANRVAHNPFVLGDAVAPTIAPISQKDYKRGSEFYARNFTEVNPYQPFASSCAVIDVINQN